jgi:OmpA-OmpF porin, OOP family
MAPTDSTAGDYVGGAAGMARFDTLISDAADRFGLGSSAGPLVREVLNMITGSPGGVAGFIKKFESAGLGQEVSSWLGRRDAPAMSSQLVDRMIGPAAIDGIANRLGLSAANTSSAVAYMLPKLIGALTPGGTVPTGLAAEQTGTRRAGEATYTERTGYGERTEWADRPRTTAAARDVEQVAPRHIEVIPDEPHLSRWLWPLLGALALLGLGSYLFTANRPAPPAPVATRAPTPRPPDAPAMLPRLSLSNENGTIRFSGAVHDQESRNAILNALKTAFGADRIQGDISVDLNRGAAPWLVNLRTALETLNVPGVQATFDGNAVNLGGIINDADRDRIANSLRTTLGGGLVFGTLGDRVANLASTANNAASAALANLRPGFTGNDLVGVLNQSIINFPTAGSEVPGPALALLHNAAGFIKQLPPGTVLEIAGHTDNTGDPAANVKLSQERADSVRTALINAGVDPSKLVAKGYGGANPVASNDLLEGRFRNRRIEYHVFKQ